MIKTSESFLFSSMNSNLGFLGFLSHLSEVSALKKVSQGSAVPASMKACCSSTQIYQFVITRNKTKTQIYQPKDSACGNSFPTPPPPTPSNPSIQPPTHPHPHHNDSNQRPAPMAQPHHHSPLRFNRPIDAGLGEEPMSDLLRRRQR